MDKPRYLLLDLIAGAGALASGSRHAAITNPKSRPLSAGSVFAYGLLRTAYDDRIER